MIEIQIRISHNQYLDDGYEITKVTGGAEAMR